MDVLLSPAVLGLIFLALVIVGVIVVVIRRRRASSDATVVPPVDIGQPVDYTSMAYEEPTSLADRFRSAPPAVRVLLLLVPLVVIGGLLALALAFTAPTGTDPTQPPPPPPPEIAITRAEVTGNGKISVIGTTNLPNNTDVTAIMQEDGQEFKWFNPDTAVSQAIDGRISLTLDRSTGAPVPSSDRQYSIQLTSNVNGLPVNSAPLNLTVTKPYEADFYQTVAAAPTAAPTEEPTEQPTEQPTAEAPVSEPTATVIGGGNIRTEPNASSEEVGQLTKGEVVTLLERTQDGAWYRVRGAEGEGWVGSVLLEISPETAAQVPAQPSAAGLATTVFNGGNVRAQPSLRGQVLDQVNAGESVTLLAKTADGQWYQITNIRNVTGWVNRTLLNLSAEITRAVPVEGAGGPSGTPVSGLSADVFNGGNLRAQPSLRGQVLDQVNAGESVTLLAKTADGRWYQVTNARSVTGWVSVTLLTIDPAVASQVPVQ